ncbi:hypothetical protein GCM10025787_02610 [Saccharopolyspora rosea]
MAFCSAAGPLVMASTVRRPISPGVFTAGLVFHNSPAYANRPDRPPARVVSRAVRSLSPVVCLVLKVPPSAPTRTTRGLCIRACTVTDLIGEWLSRPASR